MKKLFKLKNSLTIYSDGSLIIKKKNIIKYNMEKFSFKKIDYKTNYKPKNISYNFKIKNF